MIELNPPYSVMMQSYFLYDVELPGLPENVTVGGTKYYRTKHLHCSLVKLDSVVPQIIEKGGMTSDQAITLAKEVIVKAINDLKPRVESYRNEFRVAAKPSVGSQTIVIMANLTNNIELQSRIGSELGVTIPDRPAHVTIYTLANGKPIGLANQELLDSLSRALTVTELNELRSQVDIKEAFGVNV